MAIGMGARGLGACVIAGMTAAWGWAGGPPARKLQTPPAPPALAQIPVGPLGFLPPNRSWLTYRVPSATLDFIDDTHLLFTFHENALMRREEQDPDEDEDQTISALVLELPEGKIVERVHWRLHDKNRYLWALGRGRFLERERDTLYLVNKTLSTRTPYLKAEGALLLVELSPDRSQLLVEYQEPARKAEGHAGAGAPQGEAEGDAEGDAAPKAPPTLGPDAPAPRRSHRVRMMIVNTETDKVEKVSTLQSALGLTLIEGGYLGIEQSSKNAKQWNALLVPFTGEPKVVTQLTSSCQPEVHTLSQRVFAAQLCIPYTSDHLVQAYDVEGHKLWEQQWESRYVWGNYGYAENGSRFAYESIQLDHAIASLDPVDENSITGQPVGVYDVADGTLRLVEGAEPILSAGQNFALSGDGERFAVLRGGSIEVYKLPPAPVQ
jgi:hypothetical protein